MAEFHSARDIPLLAMRKAAGSGSGPRSISYNEAERSLIAFSDADGGTATVFLLSTMFTYAKLRKARLNFFLEL
jgi:hypothetical protein